MVNLIPTLLVALALGDPFALIRSERSSAERDAASWEQTAVAQATGRSEPVQPPGQNPGSQGPRRTDPRKNAVEPNTNDVVKTNQPGDQQRAHLSVPEQIAQLKRTIQSEEQELSDLKTELKDPDSEYAKALAEFDRIDKLLEARKQAKAALEQQGKTDEAQVLGAKLVTLNKMWTLAKNRSELEIDERKTLNLQIATLKDKLRRDRAALDELTGTPIPAAKMELTKGGANSASAPPDQPTPTHPGQTTAPSPESKPTAELSGNPLASGMPASPSTATREQRSDAVATSPAQDRKPNDKELLEARHEAALKAEAAKEAEKQEMSITERLEVLNKSIDLQQKSLETTRRIADNANETHKTLADLLQARTAAGTPPEKLEPLVKKMREAETEFLKHRAEVRKRSDELDRLQSQRASLLTQQMEAKKTAAAKEHESEAALEKVQELQNPFAPRNVLLWLFEHGPKILVVLLAMLVLQWLTKQFSHRFVQVMARAGHRGTGTSEEREARANTLVGVFHNALSVTITGGGILMILQESGIPIAPLLGGAAVFGLAVAFGAQNLIRDYFYGFVILLENQYKLNDVVKIGEISGQVEQITLRMTVLRDLEGNVHFVPNGQVTTVTNMTHGWSRALFDVGVAYKEDVDRVMAVINELGEQIRKEPPYSAVILEPLTMLGVDALADSAVIIKFYIKTRPLQQWTVKRELLRRIKARFDSLGIEIPFPHRTVFHRFDESAPSFETLSNRPRLRSDVSHP